MKLKLKRLLLTEDGTSWICIRQYFATDLKTNEFLMLRCVQTWLPAKGTDRRMVHKT